jgi:hypothetical protein
MVQMIVRLLQAINKGPKGPQCNEPVGKEKMFFEKAFYRRLFPLIQEVAIFEQKRGDYPYGGGIEEGGECRQHHPDGAVDAVRFEKGDDDILSLRRFDDHDHQDRQENDTGKGVSNTLPEDAGKGMDGLR